MPIIQPVEANGFVVRCGYLNDVAYFATGEGDIIFVGSSEMRAKPHAAGLLAAEPTLNGEALITSGDDGKIFVSKFDGFSTLVAERPRRWIDILAAGPSGAIAFASGRTAWVRLANGSEKEFPHERAVGGLAFAPKGMRLAVSRYDGASLWWVNTDTPKTDLAWKGAHLGICFSPDGKHVVTSMQENTLHGWRLSDVQDMRMAGYPAKVKSMSWSAKGRYLATSGAAMAVLWPFFGKTGPMGQTPSQIGAREGVLVSAVACHPTEEVVAIGYQDGVVQLSRFFDKANVSVRQAGKGPITSLGWDAKGNKLAFGSETSEAGVVSFVD